MTQANPLSDTYLQSKSVSVNLHFPQRRSFRTTVSFSTPCASVLESGHRRLPVFPALVPGVSWEAGQAKQIASLQLRDVHRNSTDQAPGSPFGNKVCPLLVQGAVGGWCITQWVRMLHL